MFHRMLLTSFLEGEFITCRQYCEALGVNYRLDLLLEVDFYLLHCNMFSVILQEVRCDDEELQQVLLTAIKNLYQAIAPVKQAG